MSRALRVSWPEVLHETNRRHYRSDIKFLQLPRTNLSDTSEIARCCAVNLGMDNKTSQCLCGDALPGPNGDNCSATQAVNTANEKFPTSTVSQPQNKTPSRYHPSEVQRLFPVCFFSFSPFLAKSFPNIVRQLTPHNVDRNPWCTYNWISSGMVLPVWWSWEVPVAISWSTREWAMECCWCRRSAGRRGPYRAAAAAARLTWGRWNPADPAAGSDWSTRDGSCRSVPATWTMKNFLVQTKVLFQAQCSKTVFWLQALFVHNVNESFAAVSTM